MPQANSILYRENLENFTLYVICVLSNSSAIFFSSNHFFKLFMIIYIKKKFLLIFYAKYLKDELNCV